MDDRIGGSFAWIKGTLILTANQDHRQDITSSNFFDATEWLISMDSNDRTWVAYNIAPEDPAILAQSIPGLTMGPRPFWPPANSLAKVFHSTIMTDLGQTDFHPNILADPELLQYFSSNFTPTNSTLDGWQGISSVSDQVIQDYGTLKTTTGPLSVQPAVIPTTYLCQVSKLKSTGNLKASVLVADFVFLQVLYSHGVDCNMAGESQGSDREPLRSLQDDP